MNVIDTAGLGKRYGDTWALRECTLAIPAGHLAALVGPNGAGKTTLLPARGRTDPEVILRAVVDLALAAVVLNAPDAAIELCNALGIGGPL
jgi:ABC-type uncharacterized transport system ATPase subunit